MEKPKYLILDEPFDALDKKSQKKLSEILNLYVTKDTTLIFTSHNSEYEEFADIIYELNDYKMELIKKS
jgi:ABC-2 type transport system ATP-binding protein